MSWLQALSVAALLFAGPVHAQAPRDQVLAESPPAHRHRIIVKYRASVAECAHCLLAHGRPFAHVTGRDGLDGLNRRFGVRGARALFSRRHDAGRSGAYRAGLADVAGRFPARTVRAPRGAALPDLSNTFVVQLAPDADPAEAAAAYAADPDVEYAEPDYRMQAAYVPSDPFFSTTGSFGQPFPDLWGLHAADAATAWDTARGDGIVVAVIDTGVRNTHRDIRASLWSNPGEIARNRIDDDGNGYVDDLVGWDFVTDRSQPRDRHGHGTHVAGTIAATGDNGLGVVGMAFGAKVMAVRGLDANGVGFVSDLAAGIVYAAENGADVLNNSWGGSPSATVRDAVQTAAGLGAVVVFAAGNANSSFLGPAADPNVIAVAASRYGDVRASFSNHGAQVSVAAPGVDVLSLRGGGRVKGQTVGGKYKVLSGTSMAAPHAAGVAALLLSAIPTLTADEVRWHLELNADQPGHPGWEGEPWNPYLGWGRINAARVFDTPPVTTRIRTPPLALHALAGAVVPEVATLDFTFTTLAPVAWTIDAPPWLAPDVGSGTGPASVPLGFDGTGLAPGTYADAVALGAPAAVDGGGSVEASAVLHRDVRVGPEIELTDSFNDYGGGPVLASDGQGVLAAWVELPTSGPPDLVGAYVAADGTVTGPFVIDLGSCVESHCHQKTASHLAAAYDGVGASFLVVWHEEIELHVGDTLRHVRHDLIRARRVTAAGQVLDAQPITVAENLENERSDGSYDQFFYNVHVAFDGAGSTVLWGRIDYAATYENAFRIYLRRVSPAGALGGPAATIYPAADTVYPQFVEPTIACASGSCLVAWHEADGETSPAGKYIDKMWGKRFAGTTPLDATPFRIVTDIESVDVIASDGSGYLAAGYRANLCPGPTLCGYDIVAGRVSGAGAALDPTGIRVNNSAPNGSALSIAPRALAFDGTSYILTWPAFGGSVGGESRCHPFAARVSPAGTVLDAEPEGLLLAPGAVLGCADPVIASLATRSLIVWPVPGARPTRIVAQGVFPH